MVVKHSWSASTYVSDGIDLTASKAGLFLGFGYHAPIINDGLNIPLTVEAAKDMIEVLEAYLDHNPVKPFTNKTLSVSMNEMLDELSRYGVDNTLHT